MLHMHTDRYMGKSRNFPRRLQQLLIFLCIVLALDTQLAEATGWIHKMHEHKYNIYIHVVKLKLYNKHYTLLLYDFVVDV